MTFTINSLFYGIGALVLIRMAKEVYEEIKRSRLPAAIPWVGVRDNEAFPKIRAWMREFTAGLTTIEEGYTKVCVIPSWYKRDLFSLLSSNKQKITKEIDVPWRVQYNTKGKPFALLDTAGRS